MLDVLGLTVVRGDNAGKFVVSAAIELYQALCEKAPNMTITTDWVKDEGSIDPNAAELIFGATNRPAGKALQAELAPPYLCHCSHRDAAADCRRR